MQTFLPYASLAESVSVFTPETARDVAISIIDILDIIHERGPWRNLGDLEAYQYHPELIKWSGHEPYLCELGLLINERLGMGSVVEHSLRENLTLATDGEYDMTAPAWFGDVDFHHAEQSAMLRLDYFSYRASFPGVPMNLPPAWTSLG